MSDLDIREALADLAALAEPRDLMPAVQQGVRRRRRRRAVVAGTSAAMTVAAVVVTAVAVGGSSGPGSTVGNGTPSSNASNSALPVAERVPHYVPAGVRIIDKGPGGAQPATSGVYHVTYRANRAKVSFVVVDDRRLPPCPTGQAAGHPRRELAPCGADIGWLSPFSPLANGYDQAINGRTAHVADEPNHFGVQDIEWREGPYHYVLMSERLNLASGPSGLPFAELVRMARSVPVDPMVPAQTPLPNPPDVAIPTPALAGYHRYQRTLIDGNGATISFSRLPRGEFSIYIVDSTHSVPTPPLYALNDIDPAQARKHGATLVQLTVRGRPATGWHGPGDMVGLRCRIGDFTVGFLGRYGVTLNDYKRIAEALQVIPHEP